MPTIVMECIKAENHPNADSLKVYEFSCSRHPTIQIVANLENVYSPGDKVMVVVAPSLMKDGTVIKKVNLRGVTSYGMALGKTDVDVGTDLTEEWNLNYDENPIFTPWPDIESLFNVRKYLTQTNDNRVVVYRAKCKVDGSNAGVQLSPSNSNGKKVIAQSRNRIITVDDDNMGFAKWVVERYDYFLNIRQRADDLGITDHIAIFGEYCGKGIMKRTAISQIDKKIFAVFAVQIGVLDAELETDPVKIGSIVPEDKDTYIIPWNGDNIIMDFSDRDQLEKSAATINKMVEDVELCDPWVKNTFGVAGIGEGVVLYPITNGTLINKQEYSDLVFKAKGEKHKVVNAKKPAQIDPEFVKTIDEFVNLFVTENRLDQIAQKVGGIDVKNTGSFLKEFCQDVQKESEAELEAADLEWRQVAKAINDQARNWWMGNVKKLG